MLHPVAAAHRDIGRVRAALDAGRRAALDALA
jgi:hypothetical protein